MTKELSAIDLLFLRLENLKSFVESSSGKAVVAQSQQIAQATIGRQPVAVTADVGYSNPSILGDALIVSGLHIGWFFLAAKAVSHLKIALQPLSNVRHH